MGTTPGSRLHIMPYRHQLYPDHRLGIIRLTGSIFGADLTRAIRDLYDDPEWDPAYSSLWDFRGVTMLALLPRDSASISRLFRTFDDRLAAPGRTAVIVSRQIDRLAAKLILRRRERYVRRPAKVFFSFGSPEPGAPDRAVLQAAAWLMVPVEILEREAGLEDA